jgi:hypothetical protein
MTEPDTSLAERVAALEAQVAKLSVMFDQFTTMCAAATEGTGPVLVELAERQLTLATAVEKLAADAGLIDRPSTTH